MPSTFTYYSYPMPLGRLTLESNGSALTALAFGEQQLKGTRQPSEITNQAATQLQEYFAGKRRHFDVPLAPAGSDFQKRVWEALLHIPYGQTRTYGEIAAAIGAPQSQRAVGGANNKNPLPLIIPCHRVVGANGTLVGYGGGTDLKRYLLELEQSTLKNEDNQ